MKLKRIHNVTFLNIREQRKEPLIATLVYCIDFNTVGFKNQAVGRRLCTRKNFPAIAHGWARFAGVSPAKETSRKVRKEMKGGNGVRKANGITQFAEGEPNVWSVHTQRRSRKLPSDVARPRATTWRLAVKEKRKPPKISFAEKPLRPTGSRLSQPQQKFSRSSSRSPQRNERR